MNESFEISTRPRIPGGLLPVCWLLISAAIIFLDMQTKAWASETLVLYRANPVMPGLNWTLAHNYGAAFSFLSDAGGWQRYLFTGLASVVTLVLLVWIFRLKRHEWLTGVALGLVIGGALGNLLDRIKLGYVVDFVDVYYKGYHWPAFNVADSAITCGVILMLLDAFLITRRQTSGKSRQKTTEDTSA